MVKLKNKTEIIKMRQGGKILASVIDEVIKHIKPGVTTVEMNELAEKLIKKAGGVPSFKDYRVSWAPKPFPSALCISINHEVVHGVPVPARKIKDGDIVGVDCGLIYDGMYTDMARTVAVGKIDKKVKKLLAITEEALYAGIKQIKPGNHISDVSKAIYDAIDNAGFYVVVQLVGHGVGYSVHEAPQVPNYVDTKSKDIKLKEGMCLALEPMANMSCVEVKTLDDGWTVVTDDGGVSAHFEHTVCVTSDGHEILTK